MGAAAHPRSKFLPRGIWKGSVPRDGSPPIMAVDSQRRRLAEIILHPEVDPDWVRRVLTELLDMVDPQPELAIVREEGASIPPWPKRESEPTPLSARAMLLLFRKH